jgi:hypothetical protein
MAWDGNRSRVRALVATGESLYGSRDGCGYRDVRAVVDGALDIEPSLAPSDRGVLVRAMRTDPEQRFSWSVMTTKDSEEGKRIEVDLRVPGYAHTRLTGTCGPDVTVEDVRQRFYHEYFGGRDAWVRDGRWGVIRHDD